MYIFLIILVLIIIFIISIFNKLTRLKNNVNKSKSGIDVYLQERFDLIPNLIEITKNYAKYESELITKITELRASYVHNKNSDILNELNTYYNDMLLTIENYPELKASEQFLKLQKSLVKVESQLQAARRIYNNDVTKYNNARTIFPNNIISFIFDFKEIPLFTLEGEKNVNVQF